MAALTLESLQKRIQHLEDVHKVQNLMGKYIYGHLAGMDATYPDTIYAKKTPGVSSEVAHWGRYEDDDFRKVYSSGKVGFPPGTMIVHTLTTPVIEVAGDGKTAKGLWISSGHESGKNPQTGELEAFWAWTKYGVDFVKEDGEWKVWHYHVYRMFKTPFDKPWTEEWEIKTGNPPGDRPVKPTKPTTYDHPYSTTTAPEYVPMPPEPYETWDDSMSY
jgi:hypothetical protein